jgi:DNA-binding NarL/FixJ family response regulator
MKRILIVDDSATLRRDFKKLLKPIKGIEVVGEAIDAESALRQCHELKPDIMILDINLKNGSGIDVLAKMKKCPVSPITIMFTNYSKGEFQKATKRLGADYFFDKTNDIEELVSTLTNLSSKQ